jgi:hypothetical protein
VVPLVPFKFASVVLMLPGMFQDICQILDDPLRRGGHAQHVRQSQWWTHIAVGLDDSGTPVVDFQSPGGLRVRVAARAESVQQRQRWNLSGAPSMRTS